MPGAAWIDDVVRQLREEEGMAPGKRAIEKTQATRGASAGATGGRRVVSVHEARAEWGFPAAAVIERLEEVARAGVDLPAAPAAPEPAPRPSDDLTWKLVVLTLGGLAFAIAALWLLVSNIGTIAAVLVFCLMVFGPVIAEAIEVTVEERSTRALTPRAPDGVVAPSHPRRRGGQRR